ncbi:hypothetical protein MRX96_036804 [Rhipicephalus microplus]
MKRTRGGRYDGCAGGSEGGEREEEGEKAPKRSNSRCGGRSQLFLPTKRVTPAKSIPPLAASATLNGTQCFPLTPDECAGGRTKSHKSAVLPRPPDNNKNEEMLREKHCREGGCRRV